MSLNKGSAYTQIYIESDRVTSYEKRDLDQPIMCERKYLCKMRALCDRFQNIPMHRVNIKFFNLNLMCSQQTSNEFTDD